MGMFRLIRLIFLVGVAFVVGVFYERNAQSEACKTQGGTLRAHICMTGG